MLNFSFLSFGKMSKNIFGVAKKKEKKKVENNFPGEILLWENVGQKTTGFVR